MGIILLSNYLLIFATDQKQGFSSFESANNLISMFVFFFNFVRPHSALNGLTPAQVASLSLPTRKKRDFPLVA